MLVSLVVAMSDDRVIGEGNTLPWHLPNDLRYFKTLTLGKPVIMGRKTHEAIGKPLPGRQNIVLTRDPLYRAPGCEVCSTLEQALALAGDCEEVMVIGGGAVYQAALGRADRIYLTEVHARIQGDTWFPKLEPGAWKEIARERHVADERNRWDHSFVTLQRR